MGRMLKHLRTCPGFHKASSIHHRYTVAHLLDRRHVVADEKIGYACLVLDILQKIQNLRLNRNVQRRYTLVRNNQLRRQRQCARNAGPLTLAAGEFVRIMLPAVFLMVIDKSSRRTTILRF